MTLRKMFEKNGIYFGDLLFDEMEKIITKYVQQETTKKLTKAKEIIRMYYLYNPSSKYSYEEIERKAETFLKE